METVLIVLAGIGLITVFVGRYMMIRDTGGDVSLLWILALRFIPFSELVYMVRHYHEARTGGIVSIVGLWLMVPWLGFRIWESENQVRGQIEQFQHLAENSGERDKLSRELLKYLPPEAASAYHREQSEHVHAKAEKVEQINARLQSWFEQLQKKRAALGTDPEQVRAFNAEAAAYSSFNALAKEENADLLALRSPVTR